MVLCNMIAGVGMVGMASVMLQEQFGGQLIGKKDIPYGELDEEDKKKTAQIGAAFVGFISIFNIAGRLGWGMASDQYGRKGIFTMFFVVGAIAYALIPHFGITKNIACFTVTTCLVVSFYGGTFSVIPAYLADLFGTQVSLL